MTQSAKTQSANTQSANTQSANTQSANTQSAKTLSGMTGFARAEGQDHGARWVFEARSVNGKGLDLKLRLPPGCEALEPTIREALGARFSRGSFQVSLSVRREDDPGAKAAALDMAFLEAMMAAAAPFVERGLARPPAFDGLLGLRGAFLPQDGQDEAVPAALMTALAAAIGPLLDSLRHARLAEGAGLCVILHGLIDTMDSLTQAAAASASAAPEALKDRLNQRLSPLLEGIGVDPQRLAQEVALLASKADVREELDRLRAHAASARALLDGPGPTGRKLDFLVQELNREANTLCAKASDLALTAIGLDLKAAIDQFREQAANVE